MSGSIKARGRREQDVYMPEVTASELLVNAKNLSEREVDSCEVGSVECQVTQTFAASRGLGSKLQVYGGIRARFKPCARPL